MVKPAEPLALADGTAAYDDCEDAWGLERRSPEAPADATAALMGRGEAPP